MEKGRWDPVKTVRTPECKVPKLLEGHKYKFRVVAESPNGDSEPLETGEPITAKNPFGELQWLAFFVSHQIFFETVHFEILHAYCDGKITASSSGDKNTIWAASWQTQQNGMCVQWILRSAWALAQSDQSIRCPHEESLGP